MRAAVVVAGDLGRSPRMQYHAHALAASGVDVSVIGYQGAPLPKFLTDNPRISIHRFYEPRFRWRIGRSKLMYGVMAFIDGFRATILLGAALMRMPEAEPAAHAEPAGLSDAACRVGRGPAAWRALRRSTGTTSGTRSSRSGSAGGILPSGSCAGWR